jgi:hypothetical protein
MKRNSIAILITILISSISYGQGKKAAGLVVIGIDRMKKIIFAELATK